MKKYHYIYKITLLKGSLTDHYYIGKHTTLAKPENCGYAGSGKIVKSYYEKYGKTKGETYDIEILEFNPDKETNAQREEVIVGLNLGNPYCLNIARGGVGGGNFGPKSEEWKKKVSEKLKGHVSFMPEGYKISEETRRKISEANKGNHYCLGRISPMKGRHHTDEAKRKLSEKGKGRVVSEETKKKLSEAKKGVPTGIPAWNKGIHLPDEMKQKIRERLTGRTIPRDVVEKRAKAQTGRKNSEDAIEKMREAKRSSFVGVLGVHVETGEIRYFDSVAEAARETDACRTCIIRCLKGQEGRTKAGSYRWMCA